MGTSLTTDQATQVMESDMGAPLASAWYGWESSLWQRRSSCAEMAEWGTFPLSSETGDKLGGLCELLVHPAEGSLPWERRHLATELGLVPGTWN